ncbi:hypothetical protein [Vibrio owensii]|uniref:type IVB secretion system protein IcmW n=1 Tax=Vibrio harveyi group TaxID=717610 RepID=UPI003CC635CE
MSHEEQVIFSPGFQSTYWSNIDPDIRKILDEFESREDWTFSFEELPEMFVEMSSSLPKVAELPLTEGNKSIIRDLIPILASMPLRQAISAISWLDSYLEEEGKIGWGAWIFLEVSDIYKNNPSDEIFLEAKIVYERIKIILRSSLAVKVFCNIKPLGVKK